MLRECVSYCLVLSATASTGLGVKRQELAARQIGGPNFAQTGELNGKPHPNEPCKRNEPAAGRSCQSC